MQALIKFYKYILRIIISHKVVFSVVIGITLVPVLLFVLMSYFIISSNDKYILDTNNPSEIRNKHAKVGLVLGAGITKNGKPYKELQARLDSAAIALNKGYVDKLILSGDNRFTYYDEPTAMKDYLVNVKHVSQNKLQPDFAGRSTYESCERTAKIFGQQNKTIIIFSAGSHLPRATYLCRKFNVEAYGIANTIEANNANRREVLARTKAVINIYIKGEPTILGEPISL